MRWVLSTALVVLSVLPFLLPVPAKAADLILNEYNAVDGDLLLEDGASDVVWGRRAGNGDDWFELVVITDHLDIRGWELVVVNDAGDTFGEESFSLGLTEDDIWSDLRSGTIITVSEELANNVDEYQPEIGRWWINVKASPQTDGTFITVACIAPTCNPLVANWKVSNKRWQLTIKDDSGAVVFGPAGEGIAPASGVGSTEVFKLEEDPGASIVPTSSYADGSSSTFGAPNVYASGTSVQDFSVLRSVVPFVQLESVRINEVLSHSDPGLDWLELHNTTDEDIDVGGWYLSDTFTDLTKYEIPAGTSIPTLSYLVFDDGDLGFAFSSACGDRAVLSEAGDGGLTGGRDFIEFGAMETGVTVGLFPNGSGELARMSEATSGAPNWLPLVGPVVINEIMYHPPDPGLGVVVDPEFIELHNPGDAVVELFTDFGAKGTYGWQLADGIDFDFALDTSIDAGDFLIVVPFDPVVEPARLAEFLTIYTLDESAPIVGPYDGKLSNFSERVALLKPDGPEAFGDICGGSGNPSPFVPYVAVDELTYSDFGEWPTEADGTGPSLERVSPLAVGNASSSWVANLSGGATPSAANSTVRQPTESQRKCLTVLNRDMARFAKTQARLNRGCLRAWSRGRLGDGALDECLRVDERRLLAAIQARVERDFMRRCSGTDIDRTAEFPFFGASSASGVRDAAVDQQIALLHDLFGTDLEAAITTEAADGRAAGCQVALATETQRCLQANLRGFNRCKRSQLEAGNIDDVAGLIACVGDDTAGGIDKVCDATVGRIRVDFDRRCGDRGVDLGVAFQGCGGVSSAQVVECLARSASCRACRTLDRADILYDDCDLFDDGSDNDSCP